MRENIVKTKSFEFAVQIVELCKNLVERKEFVLSKQLLRSGTAVGALIREAEQAESKKDFIHKMAISLKESNETEYWLELLFKTSYLDRDSYSQLQFSSRELTKLLTSIIRSTKANL